MCTALAAKEKAWQLVVPWTQDKIIFIIYHIYHLFLSVWIKIAGTLVSPVSWRPACPTRETGSPDLSWVNRIKNWARPTLVSHWIQKKKTPWSLTAFLLLVQWSGTCLICSINEIVNSDNLQLTVSFLNVQIFNVVIGQARKCSDLILWRRILVWCTHSIAPARTMRD